MRYLARRRGVAVVAAACLALAGCGSGPDATPRPTTFPVASPEAAADLAKAYLDAWAAGDHGAMYELLDPEVRARYDVDAFARLHAGFAEMAEITSLAVRATGEPETIALPPAPRPAAFPPPSPTPAPSADPSVAAATPAPTADPDAILAGPVPGIGVAFEVDAASERFGSLLLERELALVQGPDGWVVRWSPALLFPELGTDGHLELVRSLGVRGRIVGTGGVVWAETRDDGQRVYPQEALAGQVIGYATQVTAEDLVRLEAEGYRAGDLLGRSGLEAGAEELLRGTPGWSLVAVAGDGFRTTLYETEMIPGADITITIDPELQSVAQAGISGREAATAAVDPTNGDVLVLASSPAFNPNSMTIGMTLGGQPLDPAGPGQVFNKAVLGAWPAGSSLKPFALVAALETGVVTPSSTRTCPSTWRYNEAFTFRNYEDHSLPGQVTLAQAMAFSCNTTYMPLAYEVYLQEETALTDTLTEFGFGAPTGIEYVIEELGIVPDDAWLAANGRGGFTGFEQVQLAIGQGAFLGTPLQLANAYAAIGNGGTLWQARLVTRATLPDGSDVLDQAPRQIRRVSAAPADLAYVTDTLQAVVTLPYGTGTAAFAGFGLPVAGKSGTAETGGPDPHAWFPAYAPADDPTISVATVLLNIRLGTGGTDAAPLVRQVMAAHFN